jgi:hypothetical protein
MLQNASQSVVFWKEVPVFKFGPLPKPEKLGLFQKFFVILTSWRMTNGVLGSVY